MRRTRSSDSESDEDDIGMAAGGECEYFVVDEEEERASTAAAAMHKKAGSPSAAPKAAEPTPDEDEQRAAVMRAAAAATARRRKHDDSAHLPNIPSSSTSVKGKPAKARPTGAQRKAVAHMQRSVFARWRFFCSICLQWRVLKHVLAMLTLPVLCALGAFYYWYILPRQGPTAFTDAVLGGDEAVVAWFLQDAPPIFGGVAQRGQPSVFSAQGATRWLRKLTHQIVGGASHAGAMSHSDDFDFDSLPPQAQAAAQQQWRGGRLGAIFPLATAVHPLLETPLLDDEQGRLPLHLAALSNRTSMVSLLLSHGAAVDARDAGALTALHYANHVSNADMVELLLARGADPEAKDRARGRTAMHVAAITNCLPCMAALLFPPVAEQEGVAATATAATSAASPPLRAAASLRALDSQHRFPSDYSLSLHSGSLQRLLDEGWYPDPTHGAIKVIDASRFRAFQHRESQPFFQQEIQQEREQQQQHTRKQKDKAAFDARSSAPFTATTGPTAASRGQRKRKRKALRTASATISAADGTTEQPQPQHKQQQVSGMAGSYSAYAAADSMASSVAPPTPPATPAPREEAQMSSLGQKADAAAANQAADDAEWDEDAALMALFTGSEDSPAAAQRMHQAAMEAAADKQRARDQAKLLAAEHGGRLDADEFEQ